MADSDPPADLVELRRAFDAADRRCEEIASSLPSGTAIVSGEAVLTDEQRRALRAARAERLRILEQMNAHEWWATVGNRFEAGMALQRLAKG